MFEFPFAKQMAGDVAQLGERELCKLEVAGSTPVISTRLQQKVFSKEFGPFYKKGQLVL